jgi:hypothetical protein
MQQWMCIKAAGAREHPLPRSAALCDNGVPQEDVLLQRSQHCGNNGSIGTLRSANHRRLARGDGPTAGVKDQQDNWCHSMAQLSCAVPQRCSAAEDPKL